MSILTMFEVHGDPDELFALESEKVAPIAEPIAAENGRISNTVVKADFGILIVNHWENAEGMEAVAAAVRPRATEAGLPAPQNWREYEVLGYRR
jgi:hypothetical protein